MAITLRIMQIEMRSRTDEQSIATMFMPLPDDPVKAGQSMHEAMKSMLLTHIGLWDQVYFQTTIWEG